jgi:hypothetical protein
LGDRILVKSASQLALQLVSAGVLAAVFTGCAKEDVAAPGYCAPQQRPLNGAKTGVARVFMPDPIIGSGIATLAPTASNLDAHARAANLSNLLGTGVLAGKYADVRDGSVCGASYGAYDLDGQFSYSHSDARFQEAMTYYWSDKFRSELDGLGYLGSSGSSAVRAVRILANCPVTENAFFVRTADEQGQPLDLVCLGHSTATPGARYADDAMVTVHELQHATTTGVYNDHLKQFWYDEAGALNEAVSDFMALMQQQPLLGSQDPKLFSRWALGAFMPGRSSSRGAHRCPTYDPTYPACGGFPAFSADSNKISYVYPDGMGWPHANGFRGPGYASSAFSTYASQEEIHNASVLMTGALWDVYEGIRANHGGDAAAARALASKLVLEALKHLPRPYTTPITFRALASQMSLYAATVGLTASDQASMTAALTERGLLGGPQVAAHWASVGPGNASVTPGMRILDNPPRLKGWLVDMFQTLEATALVPQGIETNNGKLDPGELVAVWFDIQNGDATTAGGVTLTVTALDAYATFQEQANIGIVSSTQAQLMYGKINGTAVVSALSSSNPTYHVATGNTYFRTNPYFDRTYSHAFWVKVSPSAPSGATMRFQVQARPSNGATSTVIFSATIQ